MSNSSNTSSPSLPIISHVSIQYHDNEFKPPVEIFEDPEFQFGLFNLFIRGDIPITKNHLHIFFTIDSTGSMHDMCGDGRSKMQHILYTLENMLHVFHSKTECEISIHVQSFDTAIHEIIANVPNISSANIDQLIQQIKTIRPCGATNIEIALKSAATKIATYKEINPEHEVAHIFLTDGEITEGSRNFNKLKSFIPDDCENIFIGYGTQHDTHLLSFLGSGQNDEYRFVDALENAGLVYGEVIHGLFYKAMNNVVLQTNGCEIYDFVTNKWKTELTVGNLLSEQKKYYHLRSNTPEDSHIQVLVENNLQVDCHYVEKIDLVKYILRQKTQELLYEARKISEKTRVVDCNDDDNFNDKDPLFKAFSILNRYSSTHTNFNHEENITMKKKLKDFHVLLTNYIKENQLENDPFIRTLCDDIYISHKTAGTRYATMFTTARQTSQGRQQAYNCSTIDNIDDEANNLGKIFRPLSLAEKKWFKSHNSNSNNFDPLNIQNYTLSHNSISPYSSDGVISLMRDVSGNDGLSHFPQTDLFPSLNINVSKDEVDDLILTP